MKMQWIGCLVVAAAVAAPSSRAEEPPPFPEPAPAPAAGDPPAPAAPLPPAPPETQPAPAQAPATDAQLFDPGFADLAWVRWTGQTLRFEQARFQGDARLFARSKDRAGWQVFRGQDLEAILRASPTLANHPEVPALRAHVAGPAAVRVVVQGYSLGYEQDPDSGEARLFSRGPRGETMWTAPDLATIGAQNPDVTRLPEWAGFEARVRAANPGALPLRLRPGVGGVVVVTFAPQDVLLTLHQWRERGWQSRSYRGANVQQIVRANADLGRILDLGDAAPVPPFGFSTPTPPTPVPAAPRAPAPRAAPPSSPPAGGGTACGGGGKNCGGR